MSANNDNMVIDHPEDSVVDRDDSDDQLDADDVDEEVQDTEDADMGGDGADADIVEEIQLQNDSSAHFDVHTDSIFCIAQHPTNPNIVVTGGGDDVAYLWDSTPSGPLLPQSYQSSPDAQERESLSAIAKLANHTDSVNAVCFTYPDGQYVVTAGLDGRVNVYDTSAPDTLVGHAQEVQEINWVAACPYVNSHNTFALGASDGSVWVYRVNADDPSTPLETVQAYYLHTAASTAGAWTPDGKLLATVSEDSSLHVWDVFSEAQAAGLGTGQQQTVVSLTAADERFFVDGGLYSIAISPGGAIVAVGGAEGQVRVVSLPRLSIPSSTGAGAGGARGKSNAASSTAGAGQVGTILASLGTQSDGVETLAFSHPPLTFLAAGSVDGSIAVFDVAHNFAVRRHIKDAHDEEAVIKVDFVRPATTTTTTTTKGPASVNDRNYLLTSCGNDGVVRRWDTRGGTAAAGQGFAGEWKGHRGGGEGGGILGFVQGPGGKRIVTAGDDGVSLVFEGT